jgi:type VI secretion system protein ImpG
VHAVESAVGHVQGRAERVAIHPFHSFRHDPGSGAGGAYFRVRVRPSVVGAGIDHYVAFVDGTDRTAAPAAEVVSLKLLASNGRLAERLGPGQIDQPGSQTPATVTFSNLVGVAPEVPPPIADALLWRLVAGLARNFGSIVGAERLRALVAAYDFRALVDAQARRRLELLLDGIRGFEEAPGDALVRGAPVRLRRLSLTLAESRLGGEAEMFLFGAVMDAFLGVYAGINSLHRFEVRGAETNARYTWPPRRGAGSLL